MANSEHRDLETSTSANTTLDDQRETSIADGSDFQPNRTFHIRDHRLTSKLIEIHDVTDQMQVTYNGGDIEDELRDKARVAAIDQKRDAAYTITKEGRLFAKGFTMHAGVDGEELAHWKHPLLALQSAEITFPSGSRHGSHNLTLSPARFSGLANQWVQDSVTYEWSVESRWKLNRLSLFKKLGDRKFLIGKYTQNAIKTTAGGVLLINTNEIDEVVAILATCVSLRRMLQRKVGRMNAGAGNTVGWVAS